MTDFKNKEEYDKWKAAKVRSNQEKINQHEKEERVKNTWVCPVCMLSNSKSQYNCQCGYAIDENMFQYFRGDITPIKLYEIVQKCSNKSLPIMSQYLLKKFPESEEAQKLKGIINSCSQDIICGKCGTKITYNPKYLKKDRCERCGDWLHQYVDNKDEMQIAKEAQQKNKWNNWGFLKTIFIGIFVCFLFAFFRIKVWLVEGFTGLASFSFVDTLQFVCVLFITTKYRGNIIVRIIIFLLIPLSAYALAVLILLFGIGSIAAAK